VATGAAPVAKSQNACRQRKKRGGGRGGCPCSSFYSLNVNVHRLMVMVVHWYLFRYHCTRECIHTTGWRFCFFTTPCPLHCLRTRVCSLVSEPVQKQSA